MSILLRLVDVDSCARCNGFDGVVRARQQDDGGCQSILANIGALRINGALLRPR
jgi:alkylhydroperoxidase family enzyme